MREKHASLYIAEYPSLLAQIEQLVALVREDTNVRLLALFGSTARLEPKPTSDADVLFLLHDPHLRAAGSIWPQIIEMVVKAGEHSECAWPFSIIDGDAQASDLDPDFLENVAQDGVLLYRQAGAELPPALVGLAVGAWSAWWLVARQRRRLVAPGV